MDKILLPNEDFLSQVAELLSNGHEVVIMTKGNSMLPFIRGERDSVNLVKKDRYEIGDIVLARLALNRWVLHRLFKVEGEVAVLKGDGNLVQTEKCRLTDIVGVVREIILPDNVIVDCNTSSFRLRSKLWRSQPYLVRRCVLAIYRRLFL